MSVQMPKKPEFSRGFLAYLIISFLLLLFIYFRDNVAVWENIGALFGLIGILDGIPLLIYLYMFNNDVKEYNFAKENYEQYVKQQEERAARQRAREQALQQQLEKERQAAIWSQQNAAPWEPKYSTYPCPHCGHYKVRVAKWDDKKASVAFWGPASSKIAANYKCDFCGQMWQ